MIRVDDGDQPRGRASSTDCNGRFAKLDPYAGAQLALAESYRNVATGGAPPLAVTDCLNFGSPEDPAVMWQFAEACRGLKDACLELGIPVTGGNVSLYNQTGETAILPTPVVARARRHRGRHPAYADGLRRGRRRRSSCSARPARSSPARSGPHVVHGHLGGLPPRVDLAAEKALAALLVDAGRAGLLTSAHDLSDGGLAQALVEAVLRRPGSARRRRSRATRSSRCSPSPRPGPSSRSPATRAALAAMADGARRPAARIGTHRRRRARRRGSVRHPARRAARGLDRHAARRPRLSCPRPELGRCALLGVSRRPADRLRGG